MPGDNVEAVREAHRAFGPKGAFYPVEAVLFVVGQLVISGILTARDNDW